MTRSTEERKQPEQAAASTMLIEPEAWVAATCTTDGPPSDSSATSQPIALPQTRPGRAPASREYHRYVLWLAAGVALGVVLTFTLAVTPHRWSVIDTFHFSPRPFPLWSQLFSPEHDTFVVPSDDGLVIMQRLTERPVPLASYINGDYRLKVQTSADPFASELLN